jgi:multiple sugar transport system permease protein
MSVVIATMMLPPQVVVVPMYLVWAQQLHLTGTLWPLLIPMAFGDAFSIFLLRQFLLTIPSEYVDAAKVDGCGDFRAMIHVVLPMARPAIAAVGLFQFFYCWNDYFGPQIYASENPAAWTLSYGLETFKSAHHTDWNLTMAATLMVMAPVIIVFFFAQKAFVEGVTLTGVKG